MPQKQIIICEILKISLPYIRNGLANISLPPRMKITGRQSVAWSPPLEYEIDLKPYFELLEFVHDLPLLSETPEFSDNDFWFLNHKSRYWIENMIHHPLYEIIGSNIYRLFEIVPDEQKIHIEWPGPTGQFEK